MFIDLDCILWSINTYKKTNKNTKKQKRKRKEERKKREAVSSYD